MGSGAMLFKTWVVQIKSIYSFQARSSRNGPSYLCDIPWMPHRYLLPRGWWFMPCTHPAVRISRTSACESGPPATGQHSSCCYLPVIIAYIPASSINHNVFGYSGQCTYFIPVLSDSVLTHWKLVFTLPSDFPQTSHKTQCQVCPQTFVQPHSHVSPG